jgi:hypothetical protein
MGQRGSVEMELAPKQNACNVNTRLTADKSGLFSVDSTKCEYQKRKKLPEEVMDTTNGLGL